jgi:hypothetical protein
MSAPHAEGSGEREYCYWMSFGVRARSSPRTLSDIEGTTEGMRLPGLALTLYGDSFWKVFRTEGKQGRESGTDNGVCAPGTSD